MIFIINFKKYCLNKRVTFLSKFLNAFWFAMLCSNKYLRRARHAL